MTETLGRVWLISSTKPVVFSLQYRIAQPCLSWECRFDTEMFVAVQMIKLPMPLSLYQWCSMCQSGYSSYLHTLLATQGLPLFTLALSLFPNGTSIFEEKPLDPGVTSVLCSSVALSWSTAHSYLCCASAWLVHFSSHPSSQFTIDIYMMEERQPFVTV